MPKTKGKEKIMSDVKRAKNFEGLLELLSEAAVTLRENHTLLRRTRDTESVMAATRSEDTAKNLEFLGRDIASGLVDLIEVPFDKSAHTLTFTNSGVLLASDPDRRVGGGRRAEDKDGEITPA
jgi:hypothetical protein